MHCLSQVNTLESLNIKLACLNLNKERPDLQHCRYRRASSIRPECDLIIQQFTIPVNQLFKNHHNIFPSMNFKFAAYWFGPCQIPATRPCEYQGPVCVSRAVVCSASWHSSVTIPLLCSALTAGPWHFSLCFCLSACRQSHDSEQGWKQGAHAHFTSGRRWESPTVSE